MGASKDRTLTGFIECHMRDARFEYGPLNKQVRPMPLGQTMWAIKIGKVTHEYHCKRMVARGDVVLGYVFRYIGSVKA